MCSSSSPGLRALWFSRSYTGGAAAESSREGDTRRARTLKRILTILKVLVSQIDVLETMTPISFNSFRHRLDTASGFESAQFRALELMLGHKRASAAARYPEDSAERLRLEELMARPSLWQSFLRYLVREGYSLPEEDLPATLASHRRVAGGAGGCGSTSTATTRWCARCASASSTSTKGCRNGATCNVKMVERTIGTKHAPAARRCGVLRTTVGRAVPRPVGDPRRACERRAPSPRRGGALPHAQRAGPAYSRFRGGERLLLTGHSHQAWPDRALDGQRARGTSRAAGRREVGARLRAGGGVRAGFARLLGDRTAALCSPATPTTSCALLSALPIAREGVW